MTLNAIAPASPPHNQPAPPMISASITSALRWNSSTSSEAKPVVCDSRAPAAPASLLTFGLLARDKGLEYVIDAMPAIPRRNPRATYVIVGATHPPVRARDAEASRDIPPPRAAAASNSSASARVCVMGFSKYTCAPALNAARAIA